MEGDPSIYYLWLREHPEEQAVLLTPTLAPYLPSLCGDPSDEDDLTIAG